MPTIFRFPPAALAVFALAATTALIGCSIASVSASGTTKPAIASGNWQFSSSAAAAAPLPAFSGAISAVSFGGTTSAAGRSAAAVSTPAITGILHAQGTSSCISPASSFEVSGSADSQGNLSLSGPLAGGTLTITGALASDGKSLTKATYIVTGGTCAFLKAADAAAQAYTPISGNYDGTFTDTEGIVATISAALNQSSDANGDGNYALTGTASLPNNPCFSTSTLTLSNTEVTGGNFTFTFADPVTNATVTANGTFSSDASALTISTWTLTNCSTDAGTGAMTRQ